MQQQAWSEDDGEEPATLECPYCQEEIYEDSVQCPYCGAYISAEDSPQAWSAGRKPRWIVVTVVICLIMVAYWIFGLPFII
jgi:hypothetical protein